MKAFIETLKRIFRRKHYARVDLETAQRNRDRVFEFWLNTDLKKS